MRRAALVLTALLLLETAAVAQDPAKPSIDQNIERVAAIDKQVAELLKERAARVSDLQAEFKRLADRIDKLVGPAPTPAPPAPPRPDPAADPLRAKLKTAYDADPAAPDARRSQALDLAALYRAAVALAGDETIETSGRLLAKYADAVRVMLKDPKDGPRVLSEVRKVASAELGALLGTDAPLTADQRKAVADLFAKLAGALGDIAK